MCSLGEEGSRPGGGTDPPFSAEFIALRVESGLIEGV